MFALPLVSITTRGIEAVGGLEPGWIATHPLTSYFYAIFKDQVQINQNMAHAVEKEPPV